MPTHAEYLLFDGGTLIEGWDDKDFCGGWGWDPPCGGCGDCLARQVDKKDLLMVTVVTPEPKPPPEPKPWGPIW